MLYFAVFFTQNWSTTPVIVIMFTLGDVNCRKTEMSLPSLRERIANLKKRKDKDEEERPNHNVDPDEFETPSVCRAANHFSNTSDFKSVISPVLLTSSPKNTEEINGTSLVYCS